MITLEDLVERRRVKEKQKENSINDSLDMMQKLHESRYNSFIGVDTSCVVNMSGHVKRRNFIGETGIGVMIIENSNIVG